MEKKCSVQFANEKVKEAFEKLEDPLLKKFLERALLDIEENPFCGIQIPKKQIPKDYCKKWDIHNAWKYNLPNAWRLIYSIKGGEVIIITIVLEWLDHKEYERRFRY
jgi:mRNA-degrading endonuclease RelE of RelBE toxin-antitoxin system